jgi:16S rRNA processing protein RimM
MEEFLNIGQIINTHGVKGELKIYPLTDDIKRFRKLKTVYIESEERTVSWCKLQTDKVILKIEGIESIEDAMKYKTKYLKVKREEAAKLPEGRYFVVDIVGCKVIDENGVDLGNVSEVIFTGSNDVYWVKGKKDLLVPVLENIVKEIDIEKKEIIISPPEVWNYED